MRNKSQREVWEKNHGKILDDMKDYKRKSVADLARDTGLTRWRVYEHLDEMIKEDRSVVKEGARFRLLKPEEMKAVINLVSVAFDRLQNRSRLVNVTSEINRPDSVEIHLDKEGARAVEYSGAASIEMVRFDWRNAATAAWWDVPTE